IWNKEVYNFEHDDEYTQYLKLCEKHQELFHFEEEPSDTELSDKKLYSKARRNLTNDDQIPRSEELSNKPESEAIINMEESDSDSSSDSSSSEDSSENSNL
ncbi:20424_t:CDS:2, partial [Racocetra persica]